MKRIEYRIKRTNKFAGSKEPREYSALQNPTHACQSESMYINQWLKNELENATDLHVSYSDERPITNFA